MRVYRDLCRQGVKPKMQAASNVTTRLRGIPLLRKDEQQVDLEERGGLADGAHGRFRAHLTGLYNPKYRGGQPSALGAACGCWTCRRSCARRRNLT